MFDGGNGMIRCSKCGLANADNLKFCGHCGAQLAVPIPKPPQQIPAVPPPIPAKQPRKHVGIAIGGIVTIIIVIILILALWRYTGNNNDGDNIPVDTDGDGYPDDEDDYPNNPDYHFKTIDTEHDDYFLEAGTGMGWGCGTETTQAAGCIIPDDTKYFEITWTSTEILQVMIEEDYGGHHGTCDSQGLVYCKESTSVTNKRVDIRSAFVDGDIDEIVSGFSGCAQTVVPRQIGRQCFLVEANRDREVRMHRLIAPLYDSLLRFGVEQEETIGWDFQLYELVHVYVDVITGQNLDQLRAYPNPHQLLRAKGFRDVHSARDDVTSVGLRCPRLVQDHVLGAHT